MPYRNPVHFGGCTFPGINQALLHPRDILHRYQRGQKV